MHIRPLVPGDRAAWNPLWQGYLDFYEADISAAVTERTWQRFSDPAEPLFALGAFANQKLVGFAHYLFHRSTWSDGPYCYLEDLFVDPETRGSGVGTMLIEAVAAAAQTAEATQLYWLTHQTNERAMRVYDRVAKRSGFVHYQRKLIAD
jgi:GNAT superfamily N-acetyltransferase